MPALQDSLVFPKEAEVSETAVRMLQGLLTSADRRFSYQDVCGHAFFASVDWNNIRQSEPPDVSFVSEGDSEAKRRPADPWVAGSNLGWGACGPTEAYCGEDDT